jgi:hypothetical protein
MYIVEDTRTNMKKLFKRTITVLFLFGIVHHIQAQDNHYAWMQYGSRNSILFNAGISRFEDQSAVIMNPATLAEAKSSSFNFNTNMVGLNNITFKDGLGQGFTVKNSNLNVLPSMASGVFKPKNVKKNMTFGYALYHANTDNLNFSDRTERKLNLVNDIESPGEENYLAQYSLDNRLDEFTTVIGLGWQASEHINIGLSQSFLYRSMESRESFAAYAIPDPNAGATIDLVGANLDYYAKYTALSAFTKLGFTYKTSKWDLGLVITSPTLGIFGSGKILADYALSNYRLSQDPNVKRRSFLANGEIEDIKAKYKHPLNVALGASRAFKTWRIYGSVSWYAAINSYTVMDPGKASFVQPPTPDNVFLTSVALSVRSANRTVVNASIAADIELKKNSRLLMSFRNDQHYTDFEPDAAGNDLAIKKWDNWHFTIGNQREFKSSALTLGLRFNYGVNKDFPQPASFEDPTEGNLLQGTRGKGTIVSTGIQLLLSYSFNLGNK